MHAYMKYKSIYAFHIQKSALHIITRIVRARLFLYDAIVSFIYCDQGIIKYRRRMPPSSIRTARFNQSCIVDAAATAADARMSSQPEVNRLKKKRLRVQCITCDDVLRDRRRIKIKV